MGNNSTRAITNVFSITIGQIVNLVLNFVAITIAARSIGVEGFGRFGYMLALAVIISKVIDLGLIPIVFRELSKKKDDYSLLNTAITLRLIAFIIAVLAFNIVQLALHSSLYEMFLINILLIGSIVSAKFVCIREMLDLPFKVNLKMHVPMLFTNIDNFVLMLGIPFLSFAEDKLTFFVILYTLSNLPGFVLSLFALKKIMKFKFNFRIGNSVWLLIEAAPIFGAIILDTVFQQMDVIMLKWFSSYYDAGIYSIAFRLVGPLLVFPTAIITTLFPLFSNGKSEPQKFNLLISFSLKLFFLFALVLTVVFYFKNSEIVNLLFGEEYIKAGITAATLLFADVFVFYSFFITNLMIAWNKQSLNFYYALIVFVLHIIFSLFLIPVYFYNGVALSKLIVGVIGYILTTFYLYKSNNKVFLLNKNLLFFSLLFPLSIYAISSLSLILYLFSSLPLILGLVVFTKFFNSEEILYFFKAINKEEIGNKIVHKLKFFN